MVSCFLSIGENMLYSVFLASGRGFGTMGEVGGFVFSFYGNRFAGAVFCRGADI